MSVRPHPKQKTDARYERTWIVDFYENGRNGRRRQIQIEGTEAQAMRVEASWRAATRKPELLSFPRIEEAVPHFIKHYSLDHRPLGVDRTIRSLKVLLPFFGHLQFAAITNSEIEQYKHARLNTGVKPSTINKELAALSSMIKWAEDLGYCRPFRVRRFPPKMTRAPMPDVPLRRRSQG